MLTLFNPKKIDKALPRLAEPLFTLVERLPDSHLVACRAVLEEWFTRYPSHEQADLETRFRHRNDRTHLSAFFELYLHEMLLQRGCAVEIHPSIPGSSKSPDFRVTDEVGSQFYLEAILATDESNEEYKQRAIANQVFDYLNSNISSPDFVLGLTFYGAPKSLPARRKMVAFLNEKLENANYEKLMALFHSNERNKIPVWTYIHDGWTLEFRPIPLKPDFRGCTSGNILGAWMKGLPKTDVIETIRPEEAIRRALKTKPLGTDNSTDHT